MMNANWSYPTDIKFGAGSIKELDAVCKFHRIERPLFVTDHSLIALPTTKKIVDKLSKSFFCTVFSDISSNPSDKDLLAAIKVFRSRNHDGVMPLEVVQV